MTNQLRSLLARVEANDPATAKELRRHIDRLQGRRQFGLNFERHIPESVDLVGRPISVGDKVRFIPPRGATEVESDAIRIVTKLSGPKGKRVADLVNPKTKEEASRTVEDLVYVAEFLDPIYPGLCPSGEPVLRGGDKPFHTVINAENFHALEAMLFMHQAQVDCIYIDPPYNTRANDWKYNNDYVDPGDSYAHSKWLAFMERRLKLAKRLLNPRDSVLIVAIDANEVHRLALLLEQTFAGARIRMISTLINPKGVGVTEGFKRVDEYLFVVRFGAQDVTPSADVPLGSKPLGGTDNDARADRSAAPKRVGLDWQTARRRDLASVRPTRPAQFYPIYVNKKTEMIESVGKAIPHGLDRNDALQRDGCVAVFPVRDDGTEMNWGVTAPTFIDRWKKGYCRAGKEQPGKPQQFIIQYLKSGSIKDIEQGRAVVEGRNPDGSVIANYVELGAKAPPTQWNLRSHNAEHYGTKTVRALLPGRAFPFPKSLYAVEDVLRLFVGNKPNALILDFFAGSGTTAHATMRLNREDDGRRRSISVTNNEVAVREAHALRTAGHRPGDSEWESHGICDYITKPRIQAAVTGRTPEDNPVSESYKFADEFPMSEGFEENVEFFTLTYENPAIVELDLAFERIAPLLWMRAGSEGRRIDERSGTFDVADTYAVLFNVDASRAFLPAVDKAEKLRVAFIVTDDETQFQAVASQLRDEIDAVRLYETYLRTFQINTGRV